MKTYLIRNYLEEFNEVIHSVCVCVRVGVCVCACMCECIHIKLISS